MGGWAKRNFSRCVWLAIWLAVSIVIAAAWWHCVIDQELRAKQPFFGTNDLFNWFFPMLDRAYAEMRHGRLFLWNPYQLGGLPGLATLQSGLLYPPHLLYIFVPTAVGMGLMGIFHSLLGGWNMVCLARVLGARPAAALAAGLYFALAVVVSKYIWPPGMEAVAWLPLGIAAIEKIFRGGGISWMVGLVSAVAMPLLAGGYQTSAYMLAAYGWYTVVLLPGRRDSGRAFPSRGTAVLRIGICVAIGIALAAPQLLPTAELAQQASRPTQALPLDEVILLGNSFGTVASVAHAVLVPPDALLSVRSYLGVVAVGMAVVGLLVLDRTTFFCLTMILYGVLSLLAPPWFLSLRAAIPVLGWFRLPLREFFLAQFAVALLLARGMSVLVDTQLRPRWSGIAVLAGAACMVWGAWYRDWHTSAAALAGAGAVILLSGWVLAQSKRPAAAAALTLVFALLLAFDTVGLSHNDLRLPYSHGGWRTLYEAADLAERLDELAGAKRVAVLPLFDKRLPVKNAQLFGLFSPFDYEPLAPAVHEQCFLHADPSSPKAGSLAARQRYHGQPRIEDQSRLLVYPLKRCLDLLSVDIAVADRLAWRDVNIRGQWRNVGLSFAGVKFAGPYVFLRNPNGLPRAYAVHDAECLDTGSEQWLRLLSPEFDPRTTVVLDRSSECTTRADTSSMQGADVEIVDLEPMQVRLRTNMDRPGYVVLTDTYYPGWQAMVNGEPAQILRANGLVRAVRVPAGPVDIVFAYVPMSFYAGIAIAAAAILLIFCFAWMTRRQSITPAKGLSETGGDRTVEDESR